MNTAAKLWPKAKYVMRRDGSLLTLSDLPCAKTKLWVIGRKAAAVDAVRHASAKAAEAQKSLAAIEMESRHSCL